MIFQLFFFPKGIEINNADKTLITHYFLLRPNVIYLEDIIDYSTTKIITRSRDYEGVLINSKKGRKYLFTNYNISDYKPVKIFLDECRISFSGDQKFNSTSIYCIFLTSMV